MADWQAGTAERPGPARRPVTLVATAPHSRHAGSATAGVRTGAGRVFTVVGPVQ